MPVEVAPDNSRPGFSQLGAGPPSTPAPVMAATGKGFTVTVAVTGVPLQPFAVGVKVKVTVTGDPVLLTRVPTIFPLPDAGIEPPIVPTLSLVQSNAVPPMVPLTRIACMLAPEQTLWDVGATVTSGIGFTTTVAVAGVPVHPLAVGVIVKVTVTGALVVFVNVPLILPAPLAAMPVTVPVLSLGQL